MQPHRIETFGSLTKVETLHTIDHNVMPNSFVLETMEPFPGYYERTMPDDITPRSLFIVLKKDYPIECVLRACQRIKYFGSFSCDFTFATLWIYNNKYTAIRLKDLQDFSEIAPIQEAIVKEELELKRRKTLQASAFIRISKTFMVEEKTDGIYQDLDETDMYYLEIPELLNWNVFENLTKQVKNNITNRGFDAALAVIYRKNKVVDLIRIYDKRIDTERAARLRSNYLNEIKRNFFIPGD